MNNKKTFWMNVFFVVFWTFVGFINVADNLIIHAPPKRALMLAVIYLLVIATCFITAISIKFNKIRYIKKLAVLGNFLVVLSLITYLVLAFIKFTHFHISLVHLVILLLPSTINFYLVLVKAPLLKPCA